MTSYKIYKGPYRVNIKPSVSYGILSLNDNIFPIFYNISLPLERKHFTMKQSIFRFN